MNRILQLFTLLLTLFFTTSCDEKIEAVHYVSAGSFTNVEVINAKTGAKTELPPRTEVESYTYYQGNLFPGNHGGWIKIKLSSTGNEYLVLEKYFHYYKREYTEYRGDDGQIHRMAAPTKADKLKEAGSPLSGAIFAGVNSLHLWRHDVGPILLWLIIMAVCGYAISYLVYKDCMFDLSSKLTWILFALMVLSEFIVFCVMEPFEDDRTGGNLLLGLLIVPGIFLAAIVQWYGFPSILGQLLPFEDDFDEEKYVKGQFISFSIVAFIWFLSTYIFKQYADYVLYFFLAYIAFSLISVLIKGIREHRTWQSLLYIIIFPIFTLVFIATGVSLGIAVIGLILCAICATSFFTPPNNYGSGKSSGYVVRDEYGRTVDYTDDSGHSSSTGHDYDVP